MAGPFPSVEAEAERRHRRGPERLWGESWYFDFGAGDASLGGFVRLGLLPNLGVAWFWAALVGSNRRLVLVRDHGIELPRGAALEVRGQGLWSAVNCETPLDHWSVGMEAFGVALDDPTEAYRGERGDLVGLGFDLEWDAGAPAFGTPGGGAGYGQPCRVSGEILVGDEQLAFDGTGHRGHSWGAQDWWASSRCVASGMLDDGTAFAVVAAGRQPPAAVVSRPSPGGPELIEPGGVGIWAAVGAGGLPLSATVTLGQLSLSAAVVGQAPLLLEAPDGRTVRLARSMCAYQSGDGRRGVGWAEWLPPPEP